LQSLHDLGIFEKLTRVEELDLDGPLRVLLDLPAKRSNPFEM